MPFTQKVILALEDVTFSTTSLCCVKFGFHLCEITHPGGIWEQSRRN